MNKIRTISEHFQVELSIKYNKNIFDNLDLNKELL